jgi:tRNA threonylcarbamoyladenosine biosynthesis protein TsaB
MRVLALDTTTRGGSVALVDDDLIVDERSGDDARTHAERLPSEILALLAAHGRTTADVDLFAVASGPGSFTGLRIGIATIQGLAFVHNTPIVGVSALDALGQLASRDAAPGAFVAAWIDAHRREVFSALFRVGTAPLFAPERLAEIEPPAVNDPASTVARWREAVGDQRVVVIGDGAVLFADAVAPQAPAWRVVPPPLLAGAIGRIAVGQARRGETIDAAGLRPLYIRRPDAEVARDRRVAD